MKTVYIPKGETVCYEALYTDRLVVDGCLKTAYDIKAKTICGRGAVLAGTVSADDIHLCELEADSVCCDRLIARRVRTPELFAIESAAVSCFLSAAYVATGKLTVTASEIDVVNANEVVNLTPKKRGLFRLLMASALRSFWTALTAPAVRKEAKEVQDADYEPAPRKEETGTASQQQEPADEELNRFVNMFQLVRESGFTLRIIPGTPEENAPVFNFETEHIANKAA